MLRTTKETLAEHRQSIPWGRLSKTFQEAILVTRALDIRFIWIDSLCIIQEDEDDWSQESSEMGSIYRNCWLMIAATGAQDGSEGLFFDRGEAVAGPIQIYDEESPIYARDNIDHGDFGSWVEKTDRRLPLLSRGWTLQEQLLSPRTIHFTREELQWECGSEFSCECSPLERGGSQVSGVVSLKKYFLLNGGSTCTESWYGIVEDFSKRRLTRLDDNLPALSGIADFFQRSYSELGNYYAGLWEKDILHWLQWQCGGTAQRTAGQDYSLPAPPSWSWACIPNTPDGGIVLRSGDSHDGDLVEVLGASCFRSSTDDKGKVSGGYITLRGNVFSTFIYHGPKSDGEIGRRDFYADKYVCGDRFSGQKYRLSPLSPVSKSRDKAAYCEAGTTPEAVSSWEYESPRIVADISLDSPSESLPPGSKIYFLPLSFRTILDPGRYELYGIFIRQLTETYAVMLPGQENDFSSRAFVRIGYGECEFQKPKAVFNIHESTKEYEDMVITIV